MTRRELLAASAAAVMPAGAAPSQSYLPKIEAHLGKLIAQGTDIYGPVKTPMWMASLDIQTGRYPEQQPQAKVGQRVYRLIAAPFGSTIYWDQPQLAAAHAVSALTGKAVYSKAADAYARSFLERCVGADGIFEWGNHRYYDAFTDKPVRFEGGPHEMRPIPGAWELFWRISPSVTERAIRESTLRHLSDRATGAFNRHDDAKPGHAFLESGGILVESLCWLSKRAGDRALVDQALKIARYSFESRNPTTGLLENDRTSTRWDKLVCTTEVGVWAGSLLRAADYTGAEEFVRMAGDAIVPYLKYGYDPQAKRYYGQLRVKDGTPVKLPSQPGPKDWFPGDYSDVWNANFPSHDYPMAFAESCLELYRRSKKEVYGAGVHRFAMAIDQQPVPDTAAFGRGAYAELFGRAIHFLAGASQTFKDRQYEARARKLAEQSLDRLFADGMLRTHAGEDRYDAVDGAGYLLLALIYLEKGRKADYMGFGF